MFFTHKECPDLNGPKSKVAPNFPNFAFQNFFHTTPKSKFVWHIFRGGAMETLQGASKSQNVRKWSPPILIPNAGATRRPPNLLVVLKYIVEHFQEATLMWLWAKSPLQELEVVVCTKR